jgi:hypothetical protein
MLIHLDDRINRARDYHIGVVVRLNHGLTEKNVLRLVMPVGVRPHELDPGWLTDAEAFTSDRGTAAHQTRRLQQIPDPATELERVQRIAEGLKPIDARLTALRDR